ncbi:MAG: hypothetical protein O9293_08340 [Porphyrobacter sp.]|nr:hypothetical protein [Porphyrobacter sp.]
MIIDNLARELEVLEIVTDITVFRLQLLDERTLRSHVIVTVGTLI